MKCACLCATALLLAMQQPQGDERASSDPLADYRAGRYEAALAGFRAAIAASSDDEAAPELRANAALAALRLLRSRDAESFVAPLVDDPEWGADAAFLLGLAASQHGERAVSAAKLADAEPMAWAMATRALQRAALQFHQACRLRPDWPEAVRNLERAQRRLAEVERERDAAQAPEAKKEDAPEPPPPPEQKPEEIDVVAPELLQQRLGADDLQKLRERVRQQQRQKVQTRQDRSTDGAAGGRGW